jgi:adenosylcobyric acid synthase
MTPSTLRGAVMVCGTASNSGKSLLVAGLCRLLARRGIAVAPFKGQNMSLNSVVTAEGGEIGRAQAAQAHAAGVEPEVAMNPVLLKPTSDRRSQVVVMGRPWRVLDAARYHAAKPQLRAVVLDALAELRNRFEVVVLEGAGSPAEINLLDHDLVNLGLAAAAGVPAILVGDIDRGGVFAHLFGTVELLPAPLRARVRGIVINKLRGDPALLADAPVRLAQRLGIAALGVVPWLEGVAVDAEDSVALPSAGAGWSNNERPDGDLLDVAVIRFPRISNFTDLDALVAEPQVGLRWVGHPAELGSPDLIVLPGTKTTVADLAWFRARRLDAALGAALDAASPPALLGICGGYQMLGRRIEDPLGVEAAPGVVEGLGLVDSVTRFEPDKTTARRSGYELASGAAVTGFEIHHGVVGGGSEPAWFELATGTGGTEPEGVADPVRAVYGTSLHGVLENDELRARWLTALALRRGKPFAASPVPFAEVRRRRIDAVADACEAHLDLAALWGIVAEGARR